MALSVYSLIVVLVLSYLVTGNSVPVANQDGGGDISDAESVATTWLISQEICKTTSACSCSHGNSSHLLITCTCSDENQIVNLRRGTDSGQNFHPSLSLSLRIDNCQKLRIHPQAFAPVTGPHFDLDLTNIGQLLVKESAFELNPQIISRNLCFDNVSIDTLPPKSFPSSLNIIQFLNSQIRLISTLAFKGKTLQQILFHNTSITSIQSKAFDEEILINNSWTVDSCSIDNIETQGIASSITNMTWQGSQVGTLQGHALSGIIPSATFVNNVFHDVRTNGLTLRDWTELSFVNNSFEMVESGGLDLTQHSAQFNLTQLIGNRWGAELGTDFVKVGHSAATPFTVILDNQILQPCNCSPFFIPSVTLNGSSSWFQQQLWNNSQCLTTPKGAGCLGRSDPTQTLVSYSEWPELCSEATFLCLNELEEVSDDEEEVVSTPPLTGKLELVGILIGTVVLAISIVVIIIIIIYVCRRDRSSPEKTELERPRLHSNGRASPPVENGYSGIFSASKVTTSDNGRGSPPPANGYSGMFSASKVPMSVNGKMPMAGALPRANLIRPRSSVKVEDVEMEDKGIQTLPSDLSTEVIEGLRDKLADPESFRDARETIDHLYDLIHVSEDPRSPTTPPDVTVLPKVHLPPPPDTSHFPLTQKSTSTTTHFPPPRTSSLPKTESQLTVPVARYAQIRSKPTRSPALCPEYGYPSDIYSELIHPSQHEKGSQVNGSKVNGSTGPQMCDYTEPQDVQAHVYAELNSFPSPSNVAFNPQYRNKTFCVQRPRPIGRMTAPPTVPPPNPDAGTSCQQRPLPSIPPPFSTSTLK